MENIKKNADGTAELLATDQSCLNKVKEDATLAARELLDAAGLKAGDILVVGCSTSEVAGHMIGKASIPVVAEALLAGLFPAVRERGVYLAAQCCEHLNRALIIERACAEKYGLEEVAVRPAPKAGAPLPPPFTTKWSPPLPWRASAPTRGLTSAVRSSVCTCAPLPCPCASR